MNYFYFGIIIYCSFFYFTGDYIIYNNGEVYPIYSTGSLFTFYEEKPCFEIYDNFFIKIAFGFLYYQLIGSLIGLFITLIALFIILIALFIIYVKSILRNYSENELRIKID